MNYRHAYHAGNYGDVLKHLVLTAIIEQLHDKPNPVFVLDTHAGIGLYDLSSIEAEKTGEWKSGIARLFDGPASENPDRLVDRYLDLIRALNPGGGLKHYPGSPSIAAALARPGDRLVLAELHPEDCGMLRRWARHRPGITVHNRDGYETLSAFLPPPEGRGLILVDPPYEVVDEFDRLADAIISGHRRWPGGRWMIWHPMKDLTPVRHLQDKLVAADIGKLLSAQLLMRPVDGIGLSGSGLLLINPPYKIEAWLGKTLPWLKAALAPQHGSYAVQWLGRVE